MKWLPLLALAVLAAQSAAARELRPWLGDDQFQLSAGYRIYTEAGDDFPGITVKYLTADDARAECRKHFRALQYDDAEIARLMPKIAEGGILAVEGRTLSAFEALIVSREDGTVLARLRPDDDGVCALPLERPEALLRCRLLFPGDRVVEFTIQKAR